MNEPITPLRNLYALTAHIEPHDSINLHRNGDTWTVEVTKYAGRALSSTRRSLDDACADVLTQSREFGGRKTPT